MATETATKTRTINQVFAERAQTTPDRVALRRKVAGKWEDVTWRGYRDAARKIGLGLLKLGLERGQRVAILSNTRAEWAFADLGILGAGGTTVPIYQSNLPGEVRYILDDSEARFMFLEDLDQWQKVRGQLDELAVEKYVLIDTDDTEQTKAADAPFEGNDRVLTLDALLELGEADDAARFDEAAEAATPEEVATLIYTSGTTGKPKGVVLTHANVSVECDGLADVLEMEPDDETLAFLPLAHVFARVLHWAQVRVGYIVSFAQSLQTLKEDMGDVRPTFLAAVPRVYEKFYAGVLAKIAAKGGLAAKVATWALESALERKKRELDGEPVGLGLKLKTAAGGKPLGKVAAGLQELTGGRIKYFISGGAPLSREIGAFFDLMGITILEGYGLTETTAATHVNRPHDHKLGTVGKPIRGAEHEIAPDGEILTRGGMIMKGYHNRPDATKEVLDDDGWFHTGDIGEIDADGFLKITDRKKDLIVTAAGKNVAPQNVENHLKTHPLVSQVAMFGDKKKFCVALITIDEEQVRKALTDEGITPPEDTEALTKLPRVKELLQEAIDAKNEDLASYETIKYFDILPKDFEVGDELTPTLKVRRKKVLESYADRIEALYAGAEAH